MVSYLNGSWSAVFIFKWSNNKRHSRERVKQFFIAAPYIHSIQRLTWAQHWRGEQLVCNLHKMSSFTRAATTTQNSCQYLKIIRLHCSTNNFYYYYSIDVHQAKAWMPFFPSLLLSRWMDGATERNDREDLSSNGV